LKGRVGKTEREGRNALQKGSISRVQGKNPRKEREKKERDESDNEHARAEKGWPVRK